MKKMKGKIVGALLGAALFGVGMGHAHGQSQLLRAAPAANGFAAASPSSSPGALPPLLYYLVLAAAQSVPYIFADTSSVSLPASTR
jgi:hypothetical protein